MDDAVNHQLSETQQFRQTSAQETSSAADKTEEGESIETFEIDNTSNPESVTYLLCQLSVEILTALSLINVKLGFFDAKRTSLESYRFPAWMTCSSA